MSARDQPWWAREARLLEPIPAAEAAPLQSLGTPGGGLACNPDVATVRRIPCVLDARECASVLELASMEPRFHSSWVDATPARRDCVGAWIPPLEQARWLYRRVAEAFAEANKGYRFRIEGIIEPLLAVAYDRGGHFGWHLDTGPELSACRKLSLSILLSDPGDFEGGTLEFAGSEDPAARMEQGAACVFPSYLAHRVSPVARGRRIALVAFAYGPSFS